MLLYKIVHLTFARLLLHLLLKRYYVKNIYSSEVSFNILTFVYFVSLNILLKHNYCFIRLNNRNDVPCASVVAEILVQTLLAFNALTIVLVNQTLTNVRTV